MSVAELIASDGVLSYTVAALDKATGMGEARIRKAIKNNELPAIKESERKTIILREDADAWLKRLRDGEAAA
jgi:hypothetical protein